MVVLQHDHSLSLIDLNPRYPHVEEAYDDEEDLIVKQAFRRPCNCCSQEITYLHRYYYKCDHCDYSQHKLCVELPTKLEHASHSAHSLSLFLNESQVQCHMCKSIPWYKQLCYRCSECMFNICLDCGMDRVQHHTIYHPSHKHPLVPYRHKEILAECDACGKKHEGVFYLCVTCFRCFIHNDCVFQPKRLLIQDGTCGRFIHSHPLILSYSFPKVDQEAKFDPPCRVCDNSFSNSENRWLYKCEKCRYYVHLTCSSSGYNLKGQQNYPNVLRFPLQDQIYNKLMDFLFRKTNGMPDKHIHEHPLILVDNGHRDITSPMNKVEDLCNGCSTSIMTMPFYKCTLSGCNYVLHEWCTRLPVQIIRGCRRNPQHTLTLLPKVDRHLFGIFFCKVCWKNCNGFAYYCDECSSYIDVLCAFIPGGEIAHESHPYHLLSKVNERQDKNYCRICLSSFSHHTTETSLSCKDCNFHLHLGCALFLPETIRHRYDKHPMTLSYRPIENHGGDYFCEVCEEELNPNASFYHCQECVQSMHLACAPLMPQSKQHIFYGSGAKGVYVEDNIKFGAMYQSNGHPHPLKFLKGTESDGRCTRCKFSLEGWHILKCLQCKYAIDRYCFQELNYKPNL
ncbi:putative chromatin regulator PHD family [Helianthus debilis subsp. tardiflorus]